jgi:sulfate adenylyltransferase subunit 1
MTTDLLRFSTAGSVDDGKSTLIGRLLFDTKSLFEDQLQAIQQSSKRKGLDQIDLSLITDGLKDERDQGITIDVAYRYFSTPKRKFIIADTPGHIQYTRNMVTGTSTSNLSLILIDARKGVVEQTKRHSYIASLLQINHIIVCINKMDLVNYDEKIYNNIIEDYSNFISKLNIIDVQFVPISALDGDNIVNHSGNMSWYRGSTLLYQLENVQVGNDYNHLDTRFPIQNIIRPKTKSFHDYRGYAGRLASGILRINDKLIHLPSKSYVSVKSILISEKFVDEAFAPQSISIELNEDIDIARGDMLVKSNNICKIGNNFDAMMCWLSIETYNPKVKYILKQTSNETKVIFNKIIYKVNINNLQRFDSQLNINMNEIFRINITTSKMLYYDSYRNNKITGSFIIINEANGETVAAGMII